MMYLIDDSKKIIKFVNIMIDNRCGEIKLKLHRNSDVMAKF